MRAVFVEKPHSYEVTEMPEPEPGPDEVLVRVRACSFCGSDIHLIEEKMPGVVYPLIPGHEWTGEVRAVGERISEFAPGDRVATESHAGCGRCRNCVRGFYTICENYGQRPLHRQIGMTANGGFAQYCAVPVKLLHRLPDSMPFATGHPHDDGGIGHCRPGTVRGRNGRPRSNIRGGGDRASHHAVRAVSRGRGGLHRRYDTLPARSREKAGEPRSPFRPERRISKSLSRSGGGRGERTSRSRPRASPPFRPKASGGSAAGAGYSFSESRAGKNLPRRSTASLSTSSPSTASGARGTILSCGPSGPTRAAASIRAPLTRTSTHSRSSPTPSGYSAREKKNAIKVVLEC